MPKLPQAYMREYKPFMHDLDRGYRNPRLYCSCCGEWKQFRNKQGEQRMFLYCPHNAVNRIHLAPGPATPRILCIDCCNTQCAPNAARGLTEPPQPFRSRNAKPPKETRYRATQWDSSGEDTPASDIRVRFVKSQRAQGVLRRCEIAVGAYTETLTQVQIARLSSCTKEFRFYRGESGEERALLFHDYLQRAAQKRI